MSGRLGRGLDALIPVKRQPAPDPAEPGGAAVDVAQPPGRRRGPVTFDAAGVSVTEVTGEIASELAEVPGARFAEIPVTRIVPNHRQPRSVFDDDELAELAHSIREIGLLQPIVVRRNGAGSYQLVMGERRWRASQQAGLDFIPAIVRDTDDTAMLRNALLENLHRSQLNPLEEAAAYRQMLDDFGCSQEELSDRIGRSRPQISNTLRLLRLPPSVQRRVAAGVLSAGHARALLRLPGGDAQERMAQRVVAEGLSVRSVEELAAVEEETHPVAAQSRRRTTHAVPGGLEELTVRLSERFDTRVKVDFGRRKGKITVEFATIGDLERIVALMDPKPAATADSP